MIFTPEPYQQRMMDWMWERKTALNWAEPGLGKSVTTLTVLSNLILQGGARGVLFCCPIRVGLLTIPNECAKWEHLRWLRVVNLRTPEGVEAWEKGTADIYLVNPEMLPSMERTVKGQLKNYPGFVEKHIKGNKNLPVDVLVVDESSQTRNPSSKRFKALRNFLFDIVDVGTGKVRFKTPFERKYFLTGTPAPNGCYLALYGQLKMADNGARLGHSFGSYKQKYFKSDYMGFKFELLPGAKETIDAKVSDIALVMLASDYLEVPPCHVEDVEVDLPPSAMKAYRTLEKELLVQLKTGEVEALSAATLVIKLAQVTSGQCFDSEKNVHLIHSAKIDALKKIRKDHPKEPLLVFASFTHEKKRILEAFPEAREFKEKDLKDWQAGKIKMWVTDYRSLAFGVDGLQQGGRIAVWYSQTYDGEMYGQANARLVRRGQEKDTVIYRLLAKDTIDWAIVESLRNKDKNQQGLMSAIKNLQTLRKSE